MINTSYNTCCNSKPQVDDGRTKRIEYKRENGTVLMSQNERDGLERLAVCQWCYLIRNSHVPRLFADRRRLTLFPLPGHHSDSDSDSDSVNNPESTEY